MTESRQHYRAPVLDHRTAVLRVGVERLVVKIADESSGGLSLVCQRRPDVLCESCADLEYSDGLSIAGRVKHIEQCEAGFRIGFQRREMICESKFDLRETVTVKSEKRVSILMYATVLLVGLGVGWLGTSAKAAQFYAQVRTKWLSR